MPINSYLLIRHWVERQTLVATQWWVLKSREDGDSWRAEDRPAAAAHWDGSTYSFLERSGRSRRSSSHSSSCDTLGTDGDSFIFSSQAISAFSSISSIDSEAATSTRHSQKVRHGGHSRGNRTTLPLITQTCLNRERIRQHKAYQGPATVWGTEAISVLTDVYDHPVMCQGWI